MKTITKDVPHVRKISLQQQTYQQLICNRLQWTELEYCEFQFEAGYEFLNGVLIPVREHDKKLLSYSSMFWGWWRNHWLTRDLLAYQIPALTEEQYRRKNTSDLLKSDRLVTSFWNHIETMLKAGEERILMETKEGII